MKNIHDTTRFAIALVLASSVFAVARAERSAAFSIDCYNAAYPAGDVSNRVFSPFSYELDCCVFAEASDAVQRANIAESIGVLTDFESVYRPILNSFAASTNSASRTFLTARALCLREVGMANIAFRRAIWDLCNASVCPLLMMDGTETWFRAKMDGYMEDLELPARNAIAGHYCYYDVVYAVSRLLCDRQDADVTREFKCADGTRRNIVFSKTRSPVEYCKSSIYTLYRFPLDGGDWLCVVTVPEHESLASLQKYFSRERFRESLAALQAIGDENCKKGMCDLLLPRIEFQHETDLTDAMTANKIPASGFANLDPVLVKRDARQIVRFKLQYEEKKDCAAALFEPDEDEKETERPLLPDLGEVAIDTPFFFFVHHPGADLITVAGQFVK